MNLTDQTGPNWREIVKQIVKDMDSDDFRTKTTIFLAERNAEIAPSLMHHVDRLKTITMNPQVDEESKKRWDELKLLAEGQLSPEERREIICKLAKRYQGFIGWEGKAQDEPGW